MISREEDIGGPVISYLEEQGWEVWQEVQVRTGIADIVAMMGGRIWIVELKRSLGLSLIAQAISRLGQAHFVSVAVPQPKGGNAGHDFAVSLLEERGIGTLWVTWNMVCEHRSPHMLRRPDLRYLKGLKRKLPAHPKSFATAGNAKGKRWTRWQRTCHEIREMVRNQPGIGIKDLIDEKGGFHYASGASARTALSHWIRNGMIDGVKLVREGRRAVLYPIREDS